MEAASSCDAATESPLKRARLEKALLSISSQLKCPISGELVVDPVTTIDGQLYERSCIERWLANHDTSPSTGLRLESKKLVPCHVARSSVPALVDTEVLQLEERREWFVKRGLSLKANDAGAAKQCFENAIRLGDAKAKYHLGCMLIDEAATAGVLEARQHKGSTAAQMKASGRTASEARAAGCSGLELYDLCKKFGEGNIEGEDGTICVTKDGLFGVMQSRDLDNSGPWIIEGVGNDTTSFLSQDIIQWVRPLRW